jgi:hypothetical protein
MSINQGFCPVRLDYIPYIRGALLAPLKSRGSEGVAELIETLDLYGLSKDDLMETLHDLQFIIENDKRFCGKRTIESLSLVLNFSFLCR